MDFEFFLYSGGILAGLALALSLVLVLSEKYLADYGTCQVNINHDPEVSFSCDGGKNLLMALADQKIFIPSACGGQGTCGYCKVQINEGGGPVLPTEKGLLSRSDIRQNIRLSCQLKVKKDMELYIPDELLAVQEFKCRVEKIKSLSHDTKQVRFQLLEPDTIEFKPGQYCQLSVPQDYLLKRTPPIFEPTFRAYSIASTPSESNIVELIIRHVPNGVCTTWVHTIMKEGDEVMMTGPYGDFYLREKTDCPIVCVGGGSGVAPVRSIVKYLFGKDSKRQVYCFIGQRAVKDLYWHDVNVQRAKDHDNFIYTPSLSGLDNGDEWEGETDFIHLVIDRMIEDASEMECYLCGPPIMIDAVTETLQAKGLQADKSYFDKFS